MGDARALEPDRAVALEVSTVELEVLLDVAGIDGGPLSPWMGLGGQDGRSDGGQAGAAAALAARGFLHGGTGGDVPAPVRRILDAVSSPALVVRGQLERNGAILKVQLAAVPDLAVAHTEMEDGRHRFEPFAVSEVLLRLVDFLGLSERPPPSAQSFTVPLASLQALSESLLNGDADAAVAALAGAHVDRVTATAFVSAIRERAGSAMATVLYRIDDTHLAGGELAWLDGGVHGLWLVPFPPGADPDDDLPDREAGNSDDDLPQLTIEPTTAIEIARELLSYLPGSADEPSSPAAPE